MPNLRGLAVASLTFIVAAANAGTMTYLGFDPLSSFVTLNGNLTQVGILDFNETSLGSVEAISATPTPIVTPGQSWPDVVRSPLSNIRMELAGNMVAANLHRVSTPEQAVALQLDVWKVIADGDSTSGPNFGSGGLSASGISSAIAADADAYWQDRHTAGDFVYIRSLDSAAGDQFTAAPEPASFAALFVGGFALLRRRAVKRRL